MRKLWLLIVLLPSLGYGAQKKWTYPENPKLDDELTNIYNSINAVPNGIYKSSSMTLQGVTVDSMTVKNKASIGGATMTYPLNVKGASDSGSTSVLQGMVSNTSGNATFQSYSQGVGGGVATKIMDIGKTGLVIVYGTGGSTGRFTDLVMAAVNGSPAVISSNNQGGSPPARTYSNAVIGELDLSMTGAWTVYVFAIALNY